MKHLWFSLIWEVVVGGTQLVTTAEMTIYLNEHFLIFSQQKLNILTFIFHLIAGLSYWTGSCLLVVSNKLKNG